MVRRNSRARSAAAASPAASVRAVYPTRSANRNVGVERRRQPRCVRSSPVTVLQACINIRCRIKLHPSMKRKRKTQAERREETREEVLAAASRVFARNGFHGTSLDAVAEEAGFSRGAVYYNFADKEQLFLELLDRRCAERARDLREVFGSGGDDLASTAEQAGIAAREALEAMIGDPEWRALYLEFLAHAARDKRFRRAFARRTDEMRQALEEVVVERAALVDQDALGMTPQELAVVIDALGIGLWSHHMLHGSRAVSPDLFSRAVGLIVEGVVARAGAAAQLPLEDESADAVVASLVLCSVPDQQRALAEIRRVLRPESELRFYEHVIPHCQPKRLLLQVIDRSGLWPAIAGGCHPARDTTEAIMQAGFDIEEIESFGFSAQRFEPLIPHILGVARRT